MTTLDADQVERLEAANTAVSAINSTTDLLSLYEAVRVARTVPPMARGSAQFAELERQFTDYAKRFVARADFTRVSTGNLLRDAIVGRTGTTAAAGMSALEQEYDEAESVMRRAATVWEEVSRVRREAERSDDQGLDLLAGLPGRIEQAVGIQIRDPDNAGLGDLLGQLRDEASIAIGVRLDAHRSLRRSADSTARLLYDLASQATLAKLGPSPLPAVDEMVIAAAGRDYAKGPVLTATVAERAAGRLNSLGEADRAEMERLLARAQNPHERAYLLKALASGYTVERVGEFADKIHPFAHDRSWLDQHLAPLDTNDILHRATDNFDVVGLAGFGDARWNQENSSHGVPAAIITAGAQTDPIRALEFTGGPQPGNPAGDNSDWFRERLRNEMDRLYGAGRSWSDFGNVGVGVEGTEKLADAQIGSRLGVDYTIQPLPRIPEPIGPDMITQITRAVDNGVPVPISVVNQRSGEGYALMVIGHFEGSFQFYEPVEGRTYWRTAEAVSMGQVDERGAARLEPRAVLLPAGSGLD